MCGISGALQHGVTGDEWRIRLQKMAEVMIHRGPDDEGIWFSAEVGIGFAHRRLSIIDLSLQGHQPMHSSCDRYVIIFNGEIYNFKTLRRDLKGLGHIFRSHSDTEVMLEAVSEWGVKEAIKRFNGMFAFAIWDCKEHCLFLARDRIGEKPLYYGWTGKAFLFGSELKVLRNHPDFKAQINRDALALYLRYNCIPAPYSIYKEIYKLPPGTFLQVNLSSVEAVQTPIPYWSAREIAEKGVYNPFEGSANECIERFEDLLRDAVSQRMESDVPLGAFLSGGVDSSTVVALMQEQSKRPVKTFTIGFHEAPYNEALDAKAVAKHLGTEHTELYVTSEDAMSVIPRLPALYDEPFADSSQIPTFLVSELARSHVTVCLSGDGGDELFAGYNRYFWLQKIWSKMRYIPKSIKRCIAKSMVTLSPQRWESFFKILESVLPDMLNQRMPGDKVHKLAQIMSLENQEAMYLCLRSHWNESTSIVLGASIPATGNGWETTIQDYTQQMMYMDIVSYLPDDILVKIDRASMGVSLEARIPLLDYRIVEFAWKIPLSLKIREGQGKWLLRQVLYKYVPKELIERPKMGFGIPIDTWLRGHLKDWAESLLDERRLINEGYFRPEPIRKKWKEHLSCRQNWQYHLWSILMFQSWLEKNRN